MGQLYSHLVFRPPSIVSYESHDGFLRYVVPDAEGIPRVHRTKLIWLLTSLQVRIPCAWVRRPAAEYVVLYAHQNGEDLGSSICDAHRLAYALNVDVFAFEYSGYGLSEKPKRAMSNHSGFDRGPVAPSLRDKDRKRVEPSERGCCSDIDAAYAFVTQQCGVNPSKIIVFGRSIGSGPAVYCASTRKVGGLVLIAPIASAVRVPLKKLNVTLPFIDTFPNIDRASKIECPVLVVHGDMDELVPKVHGEKLFEKIREKGHAVEPLFIPEAKHNNVVEDFQSIVFGRYLKFLEELKIIARERKPTESDSCLRSPCLRYPNEHFRKPRRPRVHVSLWNTPRISMDNFSTLGHVGDDDRRSRDIRSRDVSTGSFHEALSYLEMKRQCSYQPYTPSCGLLFNNTALPERPGKIMSVMNRLSWRHRGSAGS